jgi:hypothetical protein
MFECNGGDIKECKEQGRQIILKENKIELKGRYLNRKGHYKTKGE